MVGLGAVRVVRWVYALTTSVPLGSSQALTVWKIMLAGRSNQRISSSDWADLGRRPNLAGASLSKMKGNPWPFIISIGRKKSGM